MSEEQEQQLSLTDDLGLDLTDEETADAEAMIHRLRETLGYDDESGGEEPDEEASPASDPAEPPVPEVPDTPEEPEAPPPPPAPEPATVDFAGVAIPAEEAKSLVDLRNYLNANPEAAERVKTAIRGAQEPAPEPQMPEWIDKFDPAQVALWERHVALEKRLGEVEKTTTLSAAEAAKARATAEANQGIETFRAAHPELSEEDVQKLRLYAVQLNVIDGLTKTRSGPEAVAKALDLAYYDHPEFKARASQEPTAKQVKEKASTERKQKLSALSGTSGSAPRVISNRAPATDHEMKDQMAKWLQEQGVLG
jgi:hypothetical protein